LLLHFLHFFADGAFRTPHSLQIFMYNLRFWAIDFLTMSKTGIIDPHPTRTMKYGAREYISFFQKTLLIGDTARYLLM